jgi:predicted nucleic acid-binding Zn ribbon protein
MADPPSETCVTCGAGPVEKILFPVAVHFKGSGFYSTDYGRSNRSGSGKEGEGGTADKPAPEKPAAEKGTSETKSSPDPG